MAGIVVLALSEFWHFVTPDAMQHQQQQKQKQ
jgi:hypothetical protein